MIAQKLFSIFLLVSIAAVFMILTPAMAQEAPPAELPAEVLQAIATGSPGATGEETEPDAIPESVAAPQTSDIEMTEDGDAFLAVPAEEEFPEPQLSETGEPLISISLDDVPLENVVRMFTRLSGANIIATATNLEGSVTVNLEDVEWKPALTSILDMHNLGLVEKIPGTGVYSIVPKSPDAPEPMLVETVFLNFTTTGHVAPVLKAIFTQGGSVSEFPSRNALVLRATSANLGEARQLIESLDIPGQQVCIETKFMELSDSAIEQLGIKWDGLGEFGIKLQDGGEGVGLWNRSSISEDIESRTDAASLWDNRNNVDTISQFYDVTGQQFEDVDSIEQIDEDTTLTKVTPTRLVTDTIDTGANYSSDIVDSFTKTIVDTQTAILDIDDFNIVLSALKETDGVSIISNPKLLVANGETGAFFSVGDREPIIKSEVTRGTEESPGDKVVSELDTTITTDLIKEGYLETGINLEVVPVIKSQGLIEAEIRPTLRRKTGTRTVGENSWPIVSVKEMKTRFTLLDGQTVAIGGLTDTQDSTETSKVPLLGDIPLIGKYLFSHTKDTTSQVETIIFVTLALADPMGIREDEGIPEHGELVYQKLLETKARRQKFHRDLAKMKEAMEAEVDAEMAAPEDPASEDMETKEEQEEPSADTDETEEDNSAADDTGARSESENDATETSGE